MLKRRYTSLAFVGIITSFMLLNTKDVNAMAIPDFTEPFEYGPYTINMPVILAEDSILWDLLTNFEQLEDTSECVSTTEAFILAHQTEMQTTFPWMWDSGDANGGAQNFCTIIDFIPDYMSGILTQEGITTNLFDDGVTSNWHTINGLVFDHELVRIEFTEEIDLLSYDFVNMVLDFADAFQANNGFLSLNSDIIQGLQSTGAIITFKNVPEFEDPVILVDGVLNESIISALEYDPEAHTVTFNTQHFTTFEVVELSSVPVEEDDDDDDDEDDKKKPKIYSAKIEHITYADGRDYYKVTAKGKNFDKKFNMYLGGRKSVKEHRINSRKAVGYFNVSEFAGDPRTEFDFRVFNSSKRKRTYDNMLPVVNIPHQYMK